MKIIHGLLSGLLVEVKERGKVDGVRCRRVDAEHLRGRRAAPLPELGELSRPQWPESEGHPSVHHWRHAPHQGRTAVESGRGGKRLPASGALVRTVSADAAIANSGANRKGEGRLPGRRADGYAPPRPKKSSPRRSRSRASRGASQSPGGARGPDRRAPPSSIRGPTNMSEFAEHFARRLAPSSGEHSFGGIMDVNVGMFAAMPPSLSCP